MSVFMKEKSVNKGEKKAKKGGKKERDYETRKPGG